MIDRLSDLPSMPLEEPETDRVRRLCHAALQQRDSNRASRLDAVLLTVSAMYFVSALLHLLTFFRR